MRRKFHTVLILQAYLNEVICNHIPDPPALITGALSDLYEELLLYFRATQLLRNSNQILHRQESNRVLVIRR